MAAIRYKVVCASVCAAVIVVIVSVTHLLLNGNIWNDLADPDEVTTRKHMIMSLNYWEQTANGLRNLADLQCWASGMNISNIVEPAIYSSPGNVFQFSGDPKVAFRDYFDISLWNSLNQAHNHSTLVSMSNFWETACKDVVFVQVLIRRKSPCLSLDQLSTQPWHFVFANHGFIMKTICIHLDSSMENEVFKRKILSVFGKPASIVFNEWRGINEKLTYRMQLKNSKCSNSFPRVMKSDEHGFPLLYSQKLQGIRDTFISRCMRGSKYVAVMVRTEKIDVSITGHSKLNESSCINQIISDRNEGLMLTGSTKTLFFTDFGEHGSSAWHYKLRNKQAASAFSNYLESSLDPFYTSQELNSRLESISGSTDSILIALLHSMLAAYAEAIVLVGGGSFQAQTLDLYTQFYRQHSHSFRRNSQCKLH